MRSLEIYLWPCDTGGDAVNDSVDDPVDDPVGDGAFWLSAAEHAAGARVWMDVYK